MNNETLSRRDFLKRIGFSGGVALATKLGLDYISKNRTLESLSTDEFIQYYLDAILKSEASNTPLLDISRWSNAFINRVIETHNCFPNTPRFIQYSNKTAPYIRAAFFSEGVLEEEQIITRIHNNAFIHEKLKISPNTSSALSKTVLENPDYDFLNLAEMWKKWRQKPNSILGFRVTHYIPWPKTNNLINSQSSYLEITELLLTINSGINTKVIHNPYIITRDKERKIIISAHTRIGTKIVSHYNDPYQYEIPNNQFSDVGQYMINFSREHASPSPPAAPTNPQIYINA